ncbi:MAG: hypothetical protein ACO3RV_03620 [Luteolibacter sp.]
MKMILMFLILALASAPLHAAERELDVKKAEKIEIRHSMIGFRNTLIFYTFKERNAVLELSIDNRDESFPVTARVHLFGLDVDAEGIAKWINNQHSCGLFPDVPTPVLTTELPQATCKVETHRQTGISKNPGPREGMFKDYELELVMAEFELAGQFKLAAFTDAARVHVPCGDAD